MATSFGQKLSMRWNLRRSCLIVSPVAGSPARPPNQALLGRFNMILDAYRALDVIAEPIRGSIRPA